MPLSVVHALAPAPFGGLETVLRHLAAGLHEAGHTVTVAPVIGPGEAETHPFVLDLAGTGVRVAPIEVSGRGYLAERRAMRDLLCEVEASVLHTHGYRPDVIDSGVAPKLGVPRVTTVHGFTGGGRKNRLYESLQRFVFRRFDAVIAVSKKLGSEIVASGVPANSVHVLQNAFPEDGSRLDRVSARRALDLPPSGPIVGWVGRLSQEKAPDVFLRAAAMVDRDDARFSLIGSGPALESCRSLADELGIGGRVHFHGRVEAAASLLTAFDLLALTSWTEGTPMVLLEAMASNVPIVTTAVGGIPDVLSNDEAVLRSAGDVEGIAAAMTTLIDDPTMARTQAEAASRRLSDDFAVRPWVDRHVELYRSIARS